MTHRSGMKSSKLVLCLPLCLMGCPQEGPLFSEDAAVDGGVEDTSAGDAAVTDGGLADAPETDAANDTGVTDSATADTGHMDVGTDAGPTVVPMAWDGTLPDEGVCTPDGFCSVYPAPTSMTGRAGWAANASDIWVGGELGLLMHWNGLAWRGVVSTGGDITQLHGCASDDVWALQSSETMNLSPDDSLSEKRLRILHWDGARWTEVPPPEGVTQVGGLHCVSSGDLWLSGPLGGVYRWNGVAWSGGRETAGVVTDLGAIAVVGDRVVVAGTPASVVWDGTSYETLATDFDIQEFGVVEEQLYALLRTNILMGEVRRLAGTTWESEAIWGTLHTIASTGRTVRVDGCPGPTLAWETDGGAWRRMETGCGGPVRWGAMALVGVPETGFLVLRTADPTTGTFSHIHGVLPATHVQDNPVDFSPSAALTMVDDAHWYVEDGGDVLERGFDGTSTMVTTIPFGRVVHWERNNLWVEETSTRTAHFDGTDWTEFRTDPMVGVSLDLIATATEAWGVSRGSHTGGLYRWQAAGGWERVEDSGNAGVWATGEDVWVRQVDGRVGRFQDGAITLLPVVDGGLEVQELMPVEAPGSGQVWVLLGASGSHQLGLWTGDAWRVITPPVPVWATDTSNWKKLVAVSGPNVWATNRRLLGDEWVPYRVGLNMEIREVTASQGSVWISAVEAMSRLPL